MCEAMEAITAMRRAAVELEAACLLVLSPVPRAFAPALNEKVPDDIVELAHRAERRMRR